ncbi:aconitate hydratase AcnA [Spirochaetia bacterium 38H-sp]|uniref:Aconitate hydratase n=1 Tax=Rarispira pelagica TaxID=3141764 RepID=A0ABU9U9V7_9SPIR
MSFRECSFDGRSVFVFEPSSVDVKGGFSSLPYSIRVLLENVARAVFFSRPGACGLEHFSDWHANTGRELSYFPSRVLMQDFTGVPAVVDLAAMRDAVAAAGGNVRRVNPGIPVDLVIDHSVQIDFWAASDALEKNVAKEYERNTERYKLLKWAGQSLDKFRTVPPNSGICHQINAEYLAQVVREDVVDGRTVVFPDSLVGTDSHTTMINGLGVMGWGVGGIEAEAVMLGEAYIMPLPEVIGVRLTGRLRDGVTATDAVLTLTELLRKKGVVGKFVEYFGPGVKALSLPDRITIANMSPEYGATMGFFPVDEVTTEFLRFTGREKEADRAEWYLKKTGMWFDPSCQPVYSDVLELDLATVEPSLAGPSRPQDRLTPSSLPRRIEKGLQELAIKDDSREVELNGSPVRVPQGAVAIASITSCTNTSNPTVLLGAGLLAKKAVEHGLSVPVWVKTSLAPGSRVVTDYLERAGVMPYLEKLGFGVVAYGCATCIGNSGPLPAAMEKAADQGLILGSVGSGNRNFEARIHQKVRFNILASPIYVVAYALAGSLLKDLEKEPLGRGKDGKEIYLADILPSAEEIAELEKQAVISADYKKTYANIFAGDKRWQELSGGEGLCYNWDESSTYIQNPPFYKLKGLPAQIKDARILGFFYDSVTTDHISPAGAIPPDYPAGKYLQEKGVKPADFNSYGSRRGNHQVMMRGTFANIRLKNRLTPDAPGGYTMLLPEGKQVFTYDAAMEYAKRGTDLVIIAGKEYGTGSSRDWAAKGTRLLGVRAVLAESFERIHRSNLVGMGVLPLCFKDGQNADTLGLSGHETITIEDLDKLKPYGECTVTATLDGRTTSFTMDVMVFSGIELEYLRAGGILPYVAKKLS